MNRLNLIQNKICPKTNKYAITNIEEAYMKTPYIIDAIRTPISKYKNINKIKDSKDMPIPPEIYLSCLIKGILKRNSYLNNDIKIDEIIIGNALGPGSNFLSCRLAQILSGIKTPLYTINRLCNSGLQAIINGHYSISSGDIDVVLAGGIESMSYNSFSSMLSRSQLPSLNNENSPEIEKLLLPMGNTNENICEKYLISREDQDLFAYKSQKKAKKAEENGLFEVEKIDIEYGNIKISKDNCIRNNCTLEGLRSLKPVFSEKGCSTAGNSSPISDGGALCLMISPKIMQIIKNKGIMPKVLGKIIGYVTVSVPPEIMGIGPSEAIPALLKKTGLNIEDVDIFEINEAFAGQALFCIRKLKIPEEKVNKLGGAIALGHPLGCSGARLIVTILHQMTRDNLRFGVVSMCVGTGMGAAVLVENCLWKGKKNNINNSN